MGTRWWWWWRFLSLPSQSWGTTSIKRRCFSSSSTKRLATYPIWWSLLSRTLLPRRSCSGRAGCSCSGNIMTFISWTLLPLLFWGSTHLSQSSISRLLFLDQYTPARRALQGFRASALPLALSFTQARGSRILRSWTSVLQRSPKFAGEILHSSGPVAPSFDPGFFFPKLAHWSYREEAW